MSQKVAADLVEVTAVAEECGWTLLQLIDRYFENLDRQLAGIREAREAGDAAGCARFAHSGVGASLMCRIPTLVPLLRRIEAHADGRELDAVDRLVEDLAEGRLRLEAELRARAMGVEEHGA